MNCELCNKEFEDVTSELLPFLLHTILHGDAINEHERIPFGNVEDLR